ncbi:MAG: hypothetical protein JKY52_19360 [Flavobacteriales bacterium]|nr:hypothetical protein [Flavobacteriales bacterium]
MLAIEIIREVYGSGRVSYVVQQPLETLFEQAHARPVEIIFRCETEEGARDVLKRHLKVLEDNKIISATRLY